MCTQPLNYIERGVPLACDCSSARCARPAARGTSATCWCRETRAVPFSPPLLPWSAPAGGFIPSRRATLPFSSSASSLQLDRSEGATVSWAAETHGKLAQREQLSKQRAENCSSLLPPLLTRLNFLPSDMFLFICVSVLVWCCPRLSTQSDVLLILQKMSCEIFFFLNKCVYKMFLGAVWWVWCYLALMGGWGQAAAGILKSWVSHSDVSLIGNSKPPSVCFWVKKLT